MTPQQQEKINRLPWFRLNAGLHNYLWELQPAAAQSIAGYLKAWSDWRYGNTGKPKPFLFLYGGTQLGKTEYLARGVGRYFIFNLGFSNAEYVYWPDYVVDQLNGGQMKINWKAPLLILDDLDHGNRPIPRSLDTWLVERMATFLKPRGSFAFRSPTIIVTNRDPLQLGEYLSHNSTGQSSEDTLVAAEQVMSVLQRYLHTVCELKPIDNEYYTWPEKEIRQRAVDTNDLDPFTNFLPAEQLQDVAF